MNATVLIPTPLRKLTHNESTVAISATTIQEMIVELEGRYHGIRNRLVDDAGEIRRFIIVFVNGEDIRFLQNQQTTLKKGDEVSIVPAIAGG